MKKQEQHKKPI